MYKGDWLLKPQPLYFFALIFHAIFNALVDEIWDVELVFIYTHDRMNT